MFLILTGEEGITKIHSFCEYIRQRGKWLKDYVESVFIPLHNKGSTSAGTTGQFP